MTTKLISGTPFLYDDTTNRIVGVHHADGTETIFANEATTESVATIAATAAATTAAVAAAAAAVDAEVTDAITTALTPYQLALTDEGATGQTLLGAGATLKTFAVGVGLTIDEADGIITINLST